MHSHDHHHHDEITLNQRFYWGISLNLALVAGEIFTGFLSGSLALLSDAGHNFSDVIGLLVSLIALRLMKSKSGSRYTYGYRKTSILAAFANAIFLLASMGAIIYEGIIRLFYQLQVPVQPKMMMFIAVAAIIINSISAYLFLHDKEKDINVKGAYLHLLSDAAISFGVLVSAVIIHFTNWFWLDPVVSILIGLFVLFSTWQLFRESLLLSLDGVPKNVDMKEVESAIINTTGVDSIHHLHVWAISTQENALTVHLVVNSSLLLSDIEKIKNKIRHSLLHLDIKHATLEVETEAGKCEDEEC